MEREINKIEKFIVKNYGKKCDDFSVFCAGCIAHRTLEDLKQIIITWK